MCFNCDAKFVLGHKCSPSQFLCLMVDAIADDQPEEHFGVDESVLDPIEKDPHPLYHFMPSQGN